MDRDERLFEMHKSIDRVFFALSIVAGILFIIAVKL